jgi:selenocysteine lyase/cysteine desulfurase
VTPTKQHYWKKIEVREEGGTPQIIGSIRAGLAVHLKERVGTEKIEQIELACSRWVLEQWTGMPGLCVMGPHSVPKLPIFSFVVRHVDSGRFLHHNFVSSLLNDVFGIQSRGGCMCAGPYAQVLPIKPVLGAVARQLACRYGGNLEFASFSP